MENEAESIVVTYLDMMDQQREQLFAALEGVLLDQVYTGKAAAGLIEYASNHWFGKEENILFIHTGGSSGLYY